VKWRESEIGTDIEWGEREMKGERDMEIYRMGERER
jgi:hypothetical protein